MTEMLHLVNADDEIVGTYSRDDIYSQGLQYVRVVEAFIRNEKDELWIPTRNDDKVIAGGGYDIGAAGHVEAGESYDEAFRKEVSEELDWNVDDLQWKRLGKLGPKDDLGTVSMIYEIQTNETPILNSADFKSADGWVLRC